MAIILATTNLYFVTAGNPYAETLQKRRCQLNSYKVQIRIANCQARDVWVNTCVGTGISYSSPTGPNYQMSHSCESCRIMEYADVDVELPCLDNGKLVSKFHRIRAAKSCMNIACCYGI